MKKILSLAITIICSTSFAVRESELAQKLNSEILPYFENAGTWSEFKGVGNKQIRYYRIHQDNPKGVIILSPGQGEPVMKYAELIYDLRSWGYSIYAIDHRGQGFSVRLLPDSQRSHVENFSDYIDDFTKFVKEHVHPENYKTSIILAHSMGGAIATGFLQKNPSGVSKAILMAPMLEINTGYLGEDWGSRFASAAVVTGFETAIAPNQHPLEKEYLTSSQERFDMNMTILDNNPNLLVGATTFRWVRESLAFTKQLRESKTSIYNIPTMMFTATDDKMVVNLGAHKICGKTLNLCKPIEMHGSAHEILMEKDSIRDRALDLIKSFIEIKEK